MRALLYHADLWWRYNTLLVLSLTVRNARVNFAMECIGAWLDVQLKGTIQVRDITGVCLDVDDEGDLAHTPVAAHVHSVRVRGKAWPMRSPGATPRNSQQAASSRRGSSRA